LQGRLEQIGAALLLVHELLRSALRSDEEGTEQDPPAHLRTCSYGANMSKRITKKGAEAFLLASAGVLAVSFLTLYFASPSLLSAVGGILGWVLFGAIWLLLVFFFLLHDERQPKKGSAAWCAAADARIAREKLYITELMREDASKATPSAPSF
jgi:hypothetical protein